MKNRITLLLSIVLAILLVASVMTGGFTKTTADTTEFLTADTTVQLENLSTAYTYDDEKTLYDNQVAAQSAYQTEYATTERTMDEPFVVINPYNMNDLSAYIAFDVDGATSYTYTVKGKNGNDFTYTGEVTGDHVVIPVVGLYEEYNNDIYVEVENGSETSSYLYNLLIEDVVPWYHSEVKYDELTADADVQELINGWLMTSNFDAYDNAGDARVYSNYLTQKRKHESLRNLGDDLSYAEIVGDTNYLYKIDLMGQVSEPVLTTESLLHHDRIYANDHYYTLENEVNCTDAEAITGTCAADYTAESNGEALVRMYDADGNKTAEIDFSDYLSDDDQVGYEVPEYDFHLNTIDYDEGTNTVIVNSRAFSTIIGLDGDTLEIKWVFGDPEKKIKKLEEYYLEPTGDIAYPHGEHTAFFNYSDRYASDFKAGNLVITMYDNNNIALKDDEFGTKDYSEPAQNGEFQNDPSNARVKTYRINLKDNTVEMLEDYELMGRSLYKSSAYDTGDFILARHDASHNFNVVDYDGNLILNVTDNVQFTDLTIEDYRGRLIYDDEIQNYVELGTTEEA